MGNKNIKILAIDDNADNLITIKAVINEVVPEAEVITALDGKTGVEIAMSFIPDVILLDIIMPDMDGFEVCKRIKNYQKLNGIPVVFLTALRGDKSNRIKALEVGAEGFLSKPIDETELTAQIQAMIKIREANKSKETETERLSTLVDMRTKELKITNIALSERETQLKDSLQQLELITENIPNIIWKSDIDSDGNFINSYISDAVDEFLNLPENTINNSFEKYFKFIKPEYMPMVYEKIQTGILNTGTKISVDYEVIKANGDSAWFLSSGQAFNENGIIKIYGTTFDITERKMHETEIKLNNNHLKSIIRILQSKCDSVNDFIDLSIDEAVKLTESEYGFFDMLDVTDINFSERRFSLNAIAQCKINKEGKCFEIKKTGILSEVFELKKPVIFNDYHTKEKDFPDGHVEINSLMAVPLMKNDEIIAVVVVANKKSEYTDADILQLTLLMNSVLQETDRKKAELELIIAKEKAEQSDKLKTAFLQNMSHEIRTPLNGILGFASLLTDNEITRNEVKKYSVLIQNSGNRLFELINNILDISKIESGNVVLNENEFSLNTVIDDVLNQFSILAESKKINLTKSVSFQTDIIVISDSLKIHQILTNLVNNAIKFTKQGFVEVSCVIDNDEIVFKVKDSGVGISLENKDKIYERFFQEDMSMSRGYEGAGLGLAISKGLAKILNGKIWYESELNKGSSFYLKIPYKKGNHIIKEQFDEKKENFENMLNKSILIAEDDDTSFSLLEMILNREKINVVRAINGIEAVDICKRRDDINCILMDIKMPLMNGIEAAKEIRVFKPDLPIIAQTAYAFTNEKDEIIASGCSDYITKPISKKTLLGLIDKYNCR